MWGFNFVALKLLYLQFKSPAALAIVRFVPMYLLLVAICRWRGESLKYSKETLPVLWQGFVAMGVYMLLFLEGMARTSAAEGAIILATAPVFSAIFSVIAKQEPFTPGAILGALIAFAGAAVVIFSGAHDGQSSLKGNLLLLGSAITWAYGAILSKPLVNKYSPIQSLTLSMPAGLLLLVPYGGLDLIKVPWSSLSTQTWLMLLHVTFGAGIVGFVGFYEGVKKIGPAPAMLYQYFVPVIAATSAYFVLHQALNVHLSLGLVIVIFGVALASRARYMAAQRLKLATS